jgi:hypothetical protein
LDGYEIQPQRLRRPLRLARYTALAGGAGDQARALVAHVAEMTYATRLKQVRYWIWMHLEVAEYRLRHDGVKPELLAYLRGIGECVR